VRRGFPELPAISSRCPNVRGQDLLHRDHDRLGDLILGGLGIVNPFAGKLQVLAWQGL
jgi:hypothetical protein